MRDIILRVWDKTEKEWCRCNVMWCDGNLGFCRPEQGKMNNKLEITQYTGLLDKQGIRIYEGDIVKEVGSYQSGTYHWENIYKVECDAPNGGFNLRSSEGKYEDLLYQDLEVIGSIYEHPELLKEKRTRL